MPKQGTRMVKNPTDKDMEKMEKSVDKLRADAAKALSESKKGFGLFYVFEDKKGKISVKQMVGGASDLKEGLMLGEAMWSMGRELGDSIVGSLVEEIQK